MTPVHESYAYRRYIQRQQAAFVPYFLVSVFSDPVTDTLLTAALASVLITIPYAKPVRYAAAVCLALEVLASAHKVWLIKSGKVEKDPARTE